MKMTDLSVTILSRMYIDCTILQLIMAITRNAKIDGVTYEYHACRRGIAYDEKIIFKII